MEIHCSHNIFFLQTPAIITLSYLKSICSLEPETPTQKFVTFTRFWCDWQQSDFRVIIRPLRVRTGSVSRVSAPRQHRISWIRHCGRGQTAGIRRADEQRSKDIGRCCRVSTTVASGTRSEVVADARLSFGQWMASAAECAPGIPRRPAVRPRRCTANYAARRLARHKWGAVKPVIYWFSERRWSSAIWPPGRKDARPQRRLHPGRNFLPEWVGPTSDRTTADQGDTGSSGGRSPAMEARESVYRRSSARVADDVRRRSAARHAASCAVALVALRSVSRTRTLPADCQQSLSKLVHYKQQWTLPMCYFTSISTYYWPAYT